MKVINTSSKEHSLGLNRGGSAGSNLNNRISSIIASPKDLKPTTSHTKVQSSVHKNIISSNFIENYNSNNKDKDPLNLLKDRVNKKSRNSNIVQKNLSNLRGRNSNNLNNGSLTQSYASADNTNFNKVSKVGSIAINNDVKKYSTTRHGSPKTPFMTSNTYNNSANNISLTMTKHNWLNTKKKDMTSNSVKKDDNNSYKGRFF